MRGGVHLQAWEVTGWSPVWDWEPKGSSGPRRWLPAGVTSARDPLSGRPSVPAQGRGPWHRWVSTPQPQPSCLLCGVDRSPRHSAQNPHPDSSHTLTPTVLRGAEPWARAKPDKSGHLVVSEYLLCSGAHYGRWGCHSDGMHTARPREASIP